MRYMMIVKASPESETGTMPSQHELDEMSKYNDELTKAGVLLAADGLHDSSKGFRVTYAAGGKTTVTDGPFAEAKELVAGFWIIQVSSRAEALEWARRIPFQEGEVEVRQVFEAEDFGA
ncbi:YciI family protein [Actinosynnema sp. ALI-1.44]|uniref:YciI family protein n=1 Tax=Actinosynnema sp. ALI-1.44 TaxID=1933779 RepID=UPI000A039EEC|nr:YciI family protein [Actinosynnema sp. ALI-1.44]